MLNNSKTVMKKVLMLRHGNYPDDPRQKKTLRENNYKVDIICLRRGNHPFLEKQKNLSVSVYHILENADQLYSILLNTQSRFLLILSLEKAGTNLIFVEFLFQVLYSQFFEKK